MVLEVLLLRADLGEFFVCLRMDELLNTFVAVELYDDHALRRPVPSMTSVSPPRTRYRPS